MYLPRIHLFEFEDQKWFPNFLRKPLLNYLSFLIIKFDVYNSITDELLDFIKEYNIKNIVGLCCGGAGDFLSIAERLARSDLYVNVTLTDLYPNRSAFEEAESLYPKMIKGYYDSVDATNVPESIQGLRIIFTAFHHFQPSIAQKIIRDAIEAAEPIAIFEFSDRKLSSVLSTFLVAGITMLFLTPSMRPLRLNQLFWTYTLILPIVQTWDAFVSQLRSYTPHELEKIVKSIEGHEKYDWNIGSSQHQKLPFTITYLMGNIKK